MKLKMGSLKAVGGIAACLSLLLIVSGVAAIRAGFFTAPTSGTVEALAVTSDSTEPEDPLEAFAAERQQLRGMQKAQLNEILYDADSEDDARAEARRQLLELCDREEKENTIEGVLRMRGFADAVCTVHGDSVNVVVRADSLGRQESAVIYDLVLRETGVTGGNVKIIPVK